MARYVQPESEVQAEGIAYLNRIPFCRARRRNTGAARRGKVFVRFSEPGDADCWFVLRGVHGECEFKATGEEPNEDQRVFLEEIRAAGGIAIWADSLDMLIRKLRKECGRRRMPLPPEA